MFFSKTFRKTYEFPHRSTVKHSGKRRSSHIVPQ
ncbi:CRISPR-associated protein Cas5 [Leptospira yasudae]|uniref:Uncharacterized protein n=1 Tax=Leptospira yasudae TaxID=2202201 RepID=A0ABX9M4L8_9LEPT|nr:hypothetical protein DLM77_10255 [Leptospira yasudae]